MDRLTGLAGNDTYVVRNAGTQIVEGTGGGTADRVLAGVSFVLVADDQIEIMTTTDSAGTTALNLTGNALSQTITGNAGVNILSDGGGAGADILSGLAGNDTYIVRNAATQITESAPNGTADRVTAGVSYVLGAGDGIEVMTTTDAAGTTALNLTGNELGQAITGNAGANRLNGGAGNDALSGLDGADVFVFSTTLGATNNDAITDYNVAADRIEIDNAVFAGLTAGVLAGTAFAANLTGQATTAAHRIIYESDTGALWFDRDGSGLVFAGCSSPIWPEHWRWRRGSSPWSDLPDGRRRSRSVGHSPKQEDVSTAGSFPPLLALAKHCPGSAEAGFFRCFLMLCGMGRASLP